MSKSFRLKISVEITHSQDDLKWNQVIEYDNTSFK